MSKLIQKKAAEAAVAKKEKEQDIVVENAVAVQSRKRKANTEAADDTVKPKTNSKKSQKGAQPGENSSVIYLGHLPNGFYESQLKKFFMQFGIVRKLKLFRSPKTGGSRGFAFLQFESPDTAQTVADAMHGYFLHERQLVAHVVPVSKQHEGMWKMRKPTEEMLVDASKKEEEVKKDVDPKKAQAALAKRMADKQKKLNELGFDFQIPALSC